jgi:glycosyltransferase involved in cell wall biosynthesis
MTHIGGGELLHSLKTQAITLGIDKHIEWTGPQSQDFVLQKLQSHDVFILPCIITGDGDRDGLPNVFMEAQSQGLPAIGTNISALPELIKDGHNGFLVDMHQPPQIADKIIILADDADLYQQCSYNAIQIMTQNFDEKTHLEQLRLLFEKYRIF